MPLCYKTKITGKGNKFNQQEQPSPNNRQRALFACDPRDFDKYFDEITDDIFIKQPNVAVYFYDSSDPVSRESMEEDLVNIILFIIPVTINTIRDDCDLQKFIDFAREKQIRLLFIQCEQGIENLFNQKYGNYQLLNKNDPDPTALGYDEKLAKFLESAIIGDELAEQIRQAFDAYIFLSYRKKDRKYANELMRLIHSNDFCRDIAIWYDEYLVPGEDFNDAIAAAMEKSGLFTMLVTPNLINEENYVHTVEFPEAKKAKKPIFPVEAEKTDKQKIAEMFEGLSNTVDIKSGNFSNELRKTIEKIALKENDKDPKHNYLIGLAYLNGIDVEVNREKAIELITSAAEAGLEEAMRTMFKIAYCSTNTNEGIDLAERLKRIYDKSNKAGGFECYNFGLEIFELLGYLYLENNELEKAKEAFRQSINQTITFGTENGINIDPTLLRRYYSMAKVYKYLGEYVNAEKLYLEVIEKLRFYRKMANVANNESDKNSIYNYEYELSLCCNNLAELYDEIKKTDEAEKLFKEVLEIRSYLVETTSEKNYEPSVADACIGLANLYTATNRYEEAEELFKKALDINRRHADRNGHKCDASIANICNNFAIFYRKTGKNDEAEKLYLESLENYRQLSENRGVSVYGPDVSGVCNNLAVLYYYDGKYDKAEKFYKESIKIIKILSEKVSKIIYNQRAISVYYNLANLYRDDGKDMEAEEYYKKALELVYELENSVDKEFIMPYIARANKELAVLFTKVQKYEKAEKHFNESLNAFGFLKEQNKESSYDYEIAVTFKEIAKMSFEKGDYKQTEQAYLLSVEIMKKLAKKDNCPDYKYETALLYCKLAETYRAIYRHDDIKHYYLEASTILIKLVEEYGEEKYGPDLWGVFNNLGSLYQEEKDYKQAEQCFLTSWFKRKQLAENNPQKHLLDYADTCNNLGSLYLRCGFKEKAVELLMESLSGYRKMAKANQDYQTDVADICNNLANAYLSIEQYDKAESLYNEAIDVYRKKMMESDDSMYVADLARALNGLGNLLRIKSDYEKSEKSFLESLVLRYKLAETVNKEAYWPYVKMTYDNLICLYQITEGSNKEQELSVAIENYDKFLSFMEKNK